ncbi:MAG: hypothetical protein RIQ89_923 [Bacteroidota bacterium]|jgi:cytochrome c oxidase subunit II
MTSLLVFIVLILATITIVRLVRVLELVNELRGEEEPVTNTDNKFNSRMMLVFLFVGLLGMLYFTLDAKKYLLPVSASKHGVETDALLDINFALIIVVFVITQILLFWYGFKYRGDKNRRAYFYPDNHKLEFIWTIIPTIVLASLIVYGLKVWNAIVAPAPADAQVVQVYGKQFNWIVRYAGEDNKLGKSNYRLIGDGNELGVDTNDVAARDDKFIADTMHIQVGSKILFVFNARDVIHSAYFPHLRTQMNCVPGMNTQFYCEPTITTDSMRAITGDANFNYVLLCNKICGAAHYNMKMILKVDSKEQYQEWYKSTAQYVITRPEAAPIADPAVTAPIDSAEGKTAVVSLPVKQGLLR